MYFNEEVCCIHSFFKNMEITKSIRDEICHLTRLLFFKTSNQSENRFSYEITPITATFLSPRIEKNDQFCLISRQLLSYLCGQLMSMIMDTTGKKDLLTHSQQCLLSDF